MVELTLPRNSWYSVAPQSRTLKVQISTNDCLFLA